MKHHHFGFTSGFQLNETIIERLVFCTNEKLTKIVDLRTGRAPRPGILWIQHLIRSKGYFKDRFPSFLKYRRKLKQSSIRIGPQKAN